MIPRRNLWNDTTVWLMLGDLRSDFAGEQLASAQDRDRGLVAGSFDREDGLYRK